MKIGDRKKTHLPILFEAPRMSKTTFLPWLEKFAAKPELFPETEVPYLSK